MKQLRAVQNRKAYILYAVIGGGMVWESHKWEIAWPVIASAILAGLIALKAALHGTKEGEAK